MTSNLDRWRIGPGDPPALDDRDPAATDGAPGDKDETRELQADQVARLSELQTRLWAEGERSLLVVLQALDAGGKDGTIRNVFSGVNPQGVRVASFKQPSAEELAHDFLWRVHRRAPGRGEIVVFNRSHYEDVLIARVNELVPKAVWSDRYDQIRAFEELLAAAGTTVVKLYLHISRDEQRERFQERLDDPTKRWKFSAGDLEVRARWDDYRTAYEDAIRKTSTEAAPWYVIPADRKWYRDWAVLEILLHTLGEMDPQFPAEEPGLDQLVIE